MDSVEFNDKLTRSSTYHQFERKQDRRNDGAGSRDKCTLPVPVYPLSEPATSWPLLADLESALAPYADHADYSRLDRELAAAFRGHGVDLNVLDPKAAGARLAGRPSTPEVAAAIDRWCRVRKTRLNVPSWRRLLEVARAADPDPWRTRLSDQLERSPADTLPLSQASATDATALQEAAREQHAAAGDIARGRR